MISKHRHEERDRLEREDGEVLRRAFEMWLIAFVYIPGHCFHGNPYTIAH